MLLWNETHPYNAVHVVRIPRELAAARLIDSIHLRLESYGLTGLVINRERGTLQYRGGPAHCEIRIVKTKESPEAALRSEIEAELNRNFLTDGPLKQLPERISPLRFFVLREEGAFYLGLVYFHFISDAVPIVFLLESIAATYTGGDSPCLSSRPDLSPGTYRDLFRISPKIFLGWLVTLPSLIRTLRTSFRSRYGDMNDHSIGFSFFSLGPSQFNALEKAGKRWGVTLNDIFLALLLKSLSPLASERVREPRRKSIAIASIVNARRDLAPHLRKTFGLFLGSFIVSHAVPEDISIQELAKDIHSQTLRIKRHKLYLRTVVELSLAHTLIPLLSPVRQKKFFPKYYPLWGGITNLNLNSLLKQKEEKSSIDYFRAVSTGPVSPLVFSITTVKDILNIGVSFKKSVFSGTEIDGIVAEFSNSLSALQVLT